MKILIVEDSELIRNHLVCLLSLVAGVNEVGVAGSHEHARLYVKIESPDVLILDIHLPDGNAIQAIKEFKQEIPNVRIAMLTNDASAFNRKKSSQMGAEWFFDKSTEYDQVLELISNLAGDTEA